MIYKMQRKYGGKNLKIYYNKNKNKKEVIILSFAQKLKTLRKERNYSQEELAQLLDVSRQAVSKWESDRGTPETDKLIQISTMFDVSLDYLLKNEQHLDNQQGTSYYVSREMMEGFLCYKRQATKRIAIGISLIVLSNAFTIAFQEYVFAVILYWITFSCGIATLVWQFFQPKRYKEIYTKQLLFDDIIIKDFKQEYEKNRKRYIFLLIVAIIIFIISPQVMLYTIEYIGYNIGFTLDWFLHALWISLAIMAGSAFYSESILAHNREYLQKKISKGKHIWVYLAIPITVVAVLVGIYMNTWNPVIPIIILFSVLLVNVCKILMEGRNKNE
ncbi:helix-turn-helix domain-containing protein [Candidatus Galacturonibacter soehngenii]|nr:helix-turn-helix transcriptional regulator [Candidatus Galacturonibacter soehngenii]